MAIKSADQITIVDITDSYSVTLSQDSFSLNGNASGQAIAQSLTTNVVVYRGDTLLTTSDVTIGSITCPTGVTAAVSGLAITLSVTTSCTGGTVSIPITVDGDVEFTKKASISVSKTGATGGKGDKGDAGDDAILIAITSDNGTVFKNATGSTTLTANVYVGGSAATISAAGVVTFGGQTLGSIFWYKDGTKVTAASKTLVVAASSVSNKMVVSAQLEG